MFVLTYTLCLLAASAQAGITLQAKAFTMVDKSEKQMKFTVSFDRTKPYCDTANLGKVPLDSVFGYSNSTSEETAEQMLPFFNGKHLCNRLPAALDNYEEVSPDHFKDLDHHLVEPCLFYQGTDGLSFKSTTLPPYMSSMLCAVRVENNEYTPVVFTTKMSYDDNKYVREYVFVNEVVNKDA